MLLRLFFLLGLFLVCCGCSRHNDCSVCDSPRVRLLQDLNVADLRGHPIAVNSDFGQVVFINFWGTWCSSCRAEVSFISGLHRDYAPLSVYFIGIAVDSTDNVISFVRKRVVDYPVYVSDVSAIQHLLEYGDENGVIPFTLLIHGHVRRAFIGKLSSRVVRNLMDKELCTVV